VVYDSLARAPLGGAAVQLVGTANGRQFARNAQGDSLGRFVVDSVPSGKYTLSFFHPVLDTLGIEPTVREITVNAPQALRADIGIPSAKRLRSAICRGAALSDTGGMVVGTVRSASDGAPLSGVAVTGEWLELSVRRNGMQRSNQRIVANTGENGWFAMCNVPTGGAMKLLASKGRDSTSAIEVQVPGEGYARQELYLGATRRPLSGTVSTEDGRPISGARVDIVGEPETRTNEQGRFTMENVPAGTRMLQVRAVGYYPAVRPVDVVAGAPALRVSMTTMKAVLDTIRVTAVSITRGLLGFEERRRSGPGRYITGDQLERLHPNSAEQVFQNVMGLKISVDGSGERILQMRSLFVGDFLHNDVQTHCAPAVYVDGFRIPSLMDSSMKPLPLPLSDIDSWIEPNRIGGIEIYQAGQVPSEFAEAMNGCGAIVIWRKR
jgi:hypothetical protein